LQAVTGQHQIRQVVAVVVLVQLVKLLQDLRAVTVALAYK
jgi:hypothetical protein